MSNEQASLLQRLGRWGTRAALAVALAALPAAWLLSTQSMTVQYIVPVDDALVAANRFLYEDEPTDSDADIVAIYGAASGEPEQVLFIDPASVIHPAENSQLALLKKGADENPLQVQTVWLLARFVTLGALAAFVFGLVGLWFLRRRAASLAGSTAVAV